MSTRQWTKTFYSVKLGDMAGPYNGFLWNLLFSALIFFTGFIGILIMRIMKGMWANQIWTYLPIFWIPIFFSWPVSLTALFGFFD